MALSVPHKEICSTGQWAQRDNSLSKKSSFPSPKSHRDSRLSTSSYIILIIRLHILQASRTLPASGPTPRMEVWKKTQRHATAPHKSKPGGNGWDIQRGIKNITGFRCFDLKTVLQNVNNSLATGSGTFQSCLFLTFTRFNGPTNILQLLKL